MNKTALKNFAVRARRKLIEEVTQKTYEAGITRDKIHDIETFEGGFRVAGRENGRVFKKYEIKQREKLLQKINEKNFDQVMEEVAYTWFNRFIALRFMEVNNYLPTGVRVLSSSQPAKREPDIIQNALSVNLDLDKDIIYRLQDSGDTQDLYKYLLIRQCNQLGEIMPDVFEQIEDYTELLLPDNLLAEGSAIRDLVDSIEEYDLKIDLNEEEQKLEEEKGEHGIEIIGWLYQYYISEKHTEIVGMNKGAIRKEDIPDSTSLFTPKWIVKYMVENTLGRLWLESHSNDDLKAKWKYYLEEAEQEPEVQKQLEELKNPNLSPEEIKILDPAIGSGHILVYAFDVLYEIYLSVGYSERDIPKLILEKNLFGLEIGDRPAQLASFALLMKARSKNRRIFKNRPILNVCSIQESNGIPKEAIEYLINPQESETEKYLHREELECLVNIFSDAKEYGSIIQVKEIDFDILEKKMDEIRNDSPTDIMAYHYRELLLEKVPPLIKQCRIMSQKFNVVVTNPPYMGNRYINNKLKEYIAEHYREVKADLFSVFIERNCLFAEKNAHLGFMTPFVWMFISSYEKLRENIISERSITSLIQLEYSGFADATVPICTFTLRNTFTGETGEYISLSNFRGADNQPIKTLVAVANSCVDYRYTSHTRSFSKIPGSPLAYWVSAEMLQTFEKGVTLDKLASPKKGLATTDNNRFLRYWFEVNTTAINIGSGSREIANNSGKKWFPLNKGGEFRRWYGNKEYIVNWGNDGSEMKQAIIKRYNGGSYTKEIRSEDKYFINSITWNALTSNITGFRFSDYGALFDSAGSSMFPKVNDVNYLLGLLNTKITTQLLNILNPTLNFGAGTVGNIPIIMAEGKRNEVDKLSSDNVSISRTDWDAFETSWDFARHPLLNDERLIVAAFAKWEREAEERFQTLKANEEELNRIFIDIYGLQDELTPEVEDKDITIHKADRERDIKSFISYAVGCMFGRYSLDKEGLIYAGGEFSEKIRLNNGTWELNTGDGWIPSSINITGDNIIPIADGDYFEDDILERFVEFVKSSFGEESLEDNLHFIAETLKMKAIETPRQAIRRYFLKDFYKDHVRMYKKRPIYWLFDSGKENGFKALIYMHRYDPFTVARVRTDYLHKLQKQFEAEMNHLDILIDSEVSSREKATAMKRKEVIRKKIQECRIYDQAIAHVANQKIEIDLDDGVKVNYSKFQGVEIPQGEGKKPIKANVLDNVSL